MGLYDKKLINFNDDLNWVGMKVRKYVSVYVLNYLNYE